jgi:hypothetical protein
MFGKTLDRTALYAFGELKSLVRDALAGKRPNTGTDLAALLFNAATEADPTIRIATYRDRFPVLLKESGSDVLTAQQPIEEFVSLLELLQESGRLAEARPHASEILEKAKGGFHDEDLKARADRLLKALQKRSRA